MNKNKDQGFTLVELLIVIVILGILATVTVFAVRGITDRGQNNACDVDQRTLDTSIEAFYAQMQRDPTTEDELLIGIDVVTATSPAGEYTDPGEIGPMLQKAPANFTFSYTAPNATYAPTALGVCV